MKNVKKIKPEIMPSCLPPEPPEMNTRLFKIQSRMQSEGVDALVLQNPDNVFYVTNFANMVHERPFILVIPSSGTPEFVVPIIEANHVMSRAVGEIALRTYKEFPATAGSTWLDQLTTVTSRFNKIGIESDSPHFLYSAVSDKSRVSSIVEDCRAVKSAYEISRHQYSSDIMTMALLEVLKISKPGALPLSIHGAVGAKMFGKLFTDLPSANFLSTKFNAAPQPQPLTDDPHNFTDLFCPLAVGGPHIVLSAGKANGYGAEVERTFFIETVPVDAVRPYQIMMEARQLAMSLTIPGASMHDVDFKVNAFLSKSGYGDNLLHRTGHGFGVTDHEGPFLAEGEYKEIQPGMVFSIEPGIYIPGLGGFRHSDTLLVTETGNQLLTHVADSLDEMTLHFS